MRCLVTGASGHLGSYLVQLLVRHEAEVFILTRPYSDLWRLEDVLARVTIVQGDLANIAASRDAIIQAEPEVVFHLGWYGVTASQRNHPEQITHNVVGSLGLWEIAQAAGCHTWIGVGSQAEYGPHQGMLSEKLSPNPTTAYGVAKLCTGLLTEKLCAMVGMRSVWLRLLATYGPKDDERHLIPSVIEQLLAHKVPALTLGEQLWDYLYVEDACEAIYQVAVTPQAKGVYNLGSGHACSVRNIVEHIRDLIDPALPLGFGAIPYQPGQVMHLQADVKRLQIDANWTAKTGLQAGLHRTIEWYSSQHNALSEARPTG